MHKCVQNNSKFSGTWKREDGGICKAHTYRMKRSGFVYNEGVCQGGLETLVGFKRNI